MQHQGQTLLGGKLYVGAQGSKLLFALHGGLGSPLVQSALSESMRVVGVIQLSYPVVLRLVVHVLGPPGMKPELVKASGNA